MPSSSETLATVSSDGWRSHTLPGLMGGLGPLLTRREGDGWAYALHLNHALSTIAWQASERTPCVTVQLNISFLGASRPGQLLVARGRVTHQTGSLLFMEGTLHADNAHVASAQAVMKRLSGLPSH
jgi:hypothetical protein